MTTFCYKKISETKLIGCVLKETRAQLHFDLTNLSKKTGIPAQYLEGLEKNDFSALPKSRSHRLAYIRSIAKELKLNSKQLTAQFIKEGGCEDIIEKNFNEKKIGRQISPYSIRVSLLLIFIIVFFTYLIWQIKGVATPPQLIIYSPMEGLVSNRQEILIQGETDKESRLLVNGEEIKVDSGGKFNSVVSLSPGVNTLTLSAIKKHGKTTTALRHVVVTGKEIDKLTK